MSIEFKAHPPYDPVILGGSPSYNDILPMPDALEVLYLLDPAYLLPITLKKLTTFDGVVVDKTYQDYINSGIVHRPDLQESILLGKRGGNPWQQTYNVMKYFDPLNNITGYAGFQYDWGTPLPCNTLPEKGHISQMPNWLPYQTGKIITPVERSVPPRLLRFFPVLPSLFFYIGNTYKNPNGPVVVYNATPYGLI